MLALYLGDGHIAMHPRAQRLRIFLDGKYEEIVDQTCELLARCFVDCTVGCQVVYGGNMKIPYVYSNHLTCLFPQHGSGMKHERSIVLEPWQQQQVEAAPWPFIRGCIRTDGCSFVNRTGPYEYLSYDFSNMSKDIIDMFTSACNRVDVKYKVTRWRSWRVRINRRDSVQRMFDHVGVKS